MTKQFDVCQWNYQNPQAAGELRVPVIVLCNTPTPELMANVAANSALDLKWVKQEPANDRPAIMVGGGASAAEHLDDIRAAVADGGVVFAMNAASQWLRGHGIAVDWQVTCDAQAKTATLVDPSARGHLFASQVNPATIAAAPNAVLWHMATPDIEAHMPPAKVKRGGYALFGGEASTGLGALCVAYALGHRKLIIIGYDSSHRGEAGHAYKQKMNDVIPVLPVEWAGKTFMASITMRTQAERFPITAQALQAAGCTIEVLGDGLLPHIWKTPAALMSERNKYQRMWLFDSYRRYSPGEQVVDLIAAMADPKGPIIDFGCGTGRAAVKLAARGHEVVLTDFVANCRDGAAMDLPFLEWDLSRPCPLRAPYGYCCDVMEHIPTEAVDDVLANIAASAETVLFTIEFRPDVMGKLIGERLHMTVKPAEWWGMKLAKQFKHVAYKGNGLFICRREAQ